MRLAMIQQYNNEQLLLNVDQLTEMLNLAKPTIYEWCAKGKIPYVKMGRRTLFHKDQILKFIESNTHYPP